MFWLIAFEQCQNRRKFEHIYVLVNCLAPPAERQRRFSNAELSVVRLSVCPSVTMGGGGGSISDTIRYLIFGIELLWDDINRI